MSAQSGMADTALLRDTQIDSGERIEEPQNPKGRNPLRQSTVLLDWLLENVPEFRRLAELREEGWNNPEGDLFFKKQRQSADKPSWQTSQFFFRMMKEIGQEMRESTNSFSVLESAMDSPTALDLCMAPGGFLHTALSLNPGARAVAFSLPESDGGHRVLLPNSSRVDLKFLDVTMLASDMGITDIPEEHPASHNMLPQQLDTIDLFDLIVCDGQVLRTHVQAQYLGNRQVGRLLASQLAIGLRHVKIGGTIIALLHKVEAPDTASLLQNFSKFASVTLFKPRKHHAKRSSFYMIATDVQNDHPEAVLAMMKWKTQWKVATFGTDEEYDKEFRIEDSDVDRLVEEFGEQLVELGRDVWATQARGLEKAPFIRK